MSLSNFKILVDSQASRDLKKLHRTHCPTLPQIIKIIDSLPNNPYQGKFLKGKKKGCYSLRQGDYRIIYEVYSPQRTIHIICVGDRKQIYR